MPWTLKVLLREDGYNLDLFYYDSENYLRNSVPYKAPYVPQFLDVEFFESPGQVVGDSNVVRIDPEVLKGDMDREERRREEEAEKEGMRHEYQTRQLRVETWPRCGPGERARPGGLGAVVAEPGAGRDPPRRETRSALLHPTVHSSTGLILLGPHPPPLSVPHDFYDLSRLPDLAVSYTHKISR